MLEHTPVEAIRYSCVEVQRSAGHDVDVISFGSQLQIPRLCNSFAKRMSCSARDDKGDGFRDEWRKSVTNEHWSEIYGVQFET